jgi:hypothetical protein
LGSLLIIQYLVAPEVEISDCSWTEVNWYNFGLIF